MATPINLVSFNVTYTSSVAYVSWNMNATVNAIGGPTITLHSLGITATNVNTLASTYYNLTLSNYTTSSVSVVSGIRTTRNRWDNATMYDINNGGIINLLSFVNGQTYNFSGIGLGFSQASGFPVPAPVNITSAIVYATGSPLLIPSTICFLKGTKILCANGEYLPIENLEEGMLVKTHLHGDVAVDKIGHMKLQSSEDKRDQLFVYKKEKNPSLNEDLILTGGHSALVDSLTENQVKQVISLMGQVYMTDDKFRLLACVDERAELYEDEEKDEEKENHTIYHLCLLHPNPDMNYGVWANGMLMETCQKVCMEKME